MIRLIAIQVALFLAPFVAYAIFAWVRDRAFDAGAIRREAPLARLALIGFAATIVAFLVLAAFDGGSATGTYVPDRLENGRLIPGHIE